MLTFNIHAHVCDPDTGCHDSDSPGAEPLWGWDRAFGIVDVMLDDDANVGTGSVDADENVLRTQPPPGTAHVRIQWSQTQVTAPPDPNSAR